MDLKQFFGLKDDPFRLTPDEEFFFPTRCHIGVKDVLKFSIDQGEGIIVVTGEPGTGKTLLLRMLLRELPKDRETCLVLTPALSPEGLLRTIIQDLGEDAPRDLDRAGLLKIVFDTLERLASRGKGLLVAIDEAQHLPVETLEQLRLLSNFETATKKIVQILLVGQPELMDLLNQPILRPFKQRVTVVERLTPLSKKELRDYLEFRLGRAGCPQNPFTPWAVRRIYRASKGIPRLVNKIASRSMFMAFSKGKRSVSRRSVKNALETMDLNKGIRRGLSPVSFAPSTALISILLAIFLVVLLIKVANNTAVREKFIAFSNMSTSLISTPTEGTKKEDALPRKILMVKARLVHVRSGPDLRFPHVCYLRYGDQVEVEDQRQKWYKVAQILFDGSYGPCQGWILSSMLSEGIRK